MPEPSLSPFLNGSPGGFKLEIAAYPGALFSEPPSPLLCFGTDDRAPLTCLLGGRMHHESLHKPRPVVFLVSRDTYPRIDEAASRLSNLDVNALWQRYYQTQRHHPALNVLASQVNSSGELLPFQPLFTCRRRRCFFAPPCPQCGRSLALCTDDNRLTANGLNAYTTTLRRYLYCPVCHESTPVFYAASPDARPVVCGPADLITRFGGLTSGELPCIGCAEHTLCYGAEPQVLRCIFPIAFYPFHLLIFDAGVLDAITYLALTAGTPLAELGQDLFIERPIVDAAEANIATPDIPSETPLVMDMPIARTTAQDDARIGQIIHDIRIRWATAAEGTAASALSPDMETQPVIPPTTNRSDDKIVPVIAAPQSDAAPVPEEDDFHTETIIVRQTLPAAEPRLQPAVPDFSEQTVVLQPTAQPAPRAEQAPLPPADADATVVIAPRTATGGESPEAATPPRRDTHTGTTSPPAASPARPTDDLMETVIMGAPAVSARSPKAADDELAETVILKPKK